MMDSPVSVSFTLCTETVAVCAGVVADHRTGTPQLPAAAVRPAERLAKAGVGRHQGSHGGQ